MSSNPGPAIYFANDKNVFDALQHRAVSRENMLEFLHDKGIYASDKEDRERLAEVIAKFTFDYHDRQWLVRLLENPNRKKKSFVKELTGEGVHEKLDEAVKKARKKLEEQGVSCKVHTKEGITTIVATYHEFDFTKTELKQKEKRVDEIQLTKTASGIEVNAPVTERGRSAVDLISGELSEQSDGVVIEHVVSLAHIRHPEARTRFFQLLIQSLDGYEVSDVTSVRVNHEAPIDEVDVADERDEPSEVEREYVGYIRKAVLDGGGVLESQEFKKLHDSGFYLSSIVWHTVEKVVGGDKVELEAQFGDADECSDFRFLVRGVFRSKEKFEHNLHKSAASRPEKELFSKLIWAAAKSAYQRVESEYCGDRSEPS